MKDFYLHTGAFASSFDRLQTLTLLNFCKNCLENFGKVQKKRYVMTMHTYHSNSSRDRANVPLIIMAVGYSRILL